MDFTELSQNRASSPHSNSLVTWAGTRARTHPLSAPPQGRRCCLWNLLLLPDIYLGFRTAEGLAHPAGPTLRGALIFLPHLTQSHWAQYIPASYTSSLGHAEIIFPFYQCPLPTAVKTALLCALSTQGSSVLDCPVVWSRWAHIR